MITGKKSFLFQRLAFVAALTGCGTKASDSTTPIPATVGAATLVADPQLSGSIVNASHGDAISAAADQSASGAGLTDDGLSNLIKETDSDTDTSTVTKTCAVSGATAVVSIDSSVNRSKTDSKKSGTVTVTRTVTGTSKVTRTWSRSDGTAVACNTAATGANADFKNPSGLKLDLSFERSREAKRTYTSTKLTRTSTKSFKASGKRAVTWSSNDTAADSATTYVRNKSIVITDVKHALVMTDKDGVTVSSALVINTAADKPLVVKVERSKTDHTVSSKTIVSGTVVVTKDTDSTITTTYADFKLGSDECKPVSGSATIVITDSAGAVLKTMVLEAGTTSDGELKDKDSGVEVEGFALDDCDSEDKKI
jgi:hypothetical protein